MEVLHPRCAGLDVHQKTVVACARIAERGEVTRDVRTFATTTQALGELAAWLAEHGITHAVMESTGVYWKPVWHILDDGDVELVLANARDVRNVPGRKTDVHDAEWLAELLAHGLVRPSFVPPRATQELRDLTRTRKQLVREGAQHTQRIQKILEDCNVKLVGVLTDIMGKSGRAILDAIVGGENDPQKLADLAVGKARSKRDALIEALNGRVREHHRQLIRMHLGLYTAIAKSIEEIDVTLGKALAPTEVLVELLKTAPGIGDLTAQVILAEVGADMSRFPTPGHLLSWAGLVPGCHESAGKRRSTRLKPGAPWLKATLVQAAWAAASAKSTYLRSKFLRIKARRGAKKAVIAVAGSLLKAAFFMLRDGVVYEDLGPNHFDRRDTKKTVQRLTRRLKELGFDVDLKPVEVMPAV